jgi:putative ubiquitin-RnfH superfamily antitoxin RatB of RatAB toxin-antitoxin module
VNVPLRRVQVVYATTRCQEIIEVELPAGSTVEDAIRRSGILARFREIDLTRDRIGIYGEFVRLQDAVQDGDRIEIYRPLQADPKDIRRARAGKRPGRSKRL